MLSTACTNGNLRLVGGRHACEGRLEICLHGSWGTVCDDHFSNVDARVACRQLGYNTTCNSHTIKCCYIHVNIVDIILL